jgi:hypothetical protein
MLASGAAHSANSEQTRSDQDLGVLLFIDGFLMNPEAL